MLDYIQNSDIVWRLNLAELDTPTSVEIRVYKGIRKETLCQFATPEKEDYLPIVVDGDNYTFVIPKEVTEATEGTIGIEITAEVNGLNVVAQASIGKINPKATRIDGDNS
jgi:hypothetical protein